jgi:hypothetical protein
MLVMVLPCHADDSATGATWPRRDVDVESCWRRFGRVMLATALPGRFGRDVMYMPSHASDGAAGATWPWRDVDVESCW